MFWNSEKVAFHFASINEIPLKLSKKKKIIKKDLVVKINKLHFVLK